MRKKRGSLAARLPHKHGDIVCFQWFRAWQWQRVAGPATLRKYLKVKQKRGGVADAWQPSTNVHSRGAYATTGSRSVGGFFKPKKEGVKNRRRPRSGVSREVGLEGDLFSWLTEGAGGRSLCSTPHEAWGR